MRILSLRGGGIRGLATAALLERFEACTGKRVCDCFTFLAGTSTGGIIALGLALGLPAARMVDLYLERGPRIFRRRLRSYLGVFGAKYDVFTLHNELSAAYRGAPLRECKVPVMLTMTAVSNNGARFAKSWKHGSVRAADAGAATAAAPTYFDPWEIATAPGFEGGAFRDGGMFGNNPAPYAAVELFDPDFPVPPGSAGRSAVLVDAATPARPPRTFRGNGIFHVAPNLADLFMDSGADANATVARRLLGPDRYLEIVPPLGTAAPAMDDVSRPNLEALIAAGHRAADTALPRLEALLA